MSKGRLTHLFQKYADRTCTQAEYAELMALITDENKATEIDMLMNDEWENHVNGPELDKNNVNQLFGRVLSAVDYDEATDQPVKLNPVRSWIIWAAATVLLGVLVFLYYGSNRSDSITPNQAEIVNNKTESLINLVAVDEHRKIKLPDGSIVILNNKSTLEFPEDFLGSTREVVLKGEGYFDIKHNPEKPFIVHTGKISTTVLGTAFNIKAYDKENDVVVTVTRGKVMVKNEHKTLGIITPDQQIIFNKTEMKSLLKPVLASKTVEWQEKDLFFDDVTMDEATVQLAKRFNVNIKFANEQSKDCRFTATFLKEESLDEILQIITSFNHITYQKKAQEIIISGKGCK
ncbi:FecR family protein [Pedobacter nyackensis]|uniref:FecR family protein n=1 Tax=Pedobacter nyackensis TaxID=475255 RepID=A0A1W2C719_9SPHI|nr:FecR domain-containing protein [Pedobacter nyackensis]SMC80814.1 FecR family protein [Pedobacter nyackensis]